jgi:hypothetical protein
MKWLNETNPSQAAAWIAQKFDSWHVNIFLFSGFLASEHREFLSRGFNGRSDKTTIFLRLALRLITCRAMLHLLYRPSGRAA